MVKKMEIETRNEKNIIGKLKAVIWLMLVFTALFLIIYRYGEMIDLNYDINAMKNEYREEVAINSSLYAKLDENANIDEIKYIAETRLDMNKPRADQIIYVSTKMTDDHNSQRKDNMYSRSLIVFNRVKNTFDNIMKIFKGSLNP